MQTADSLGNSAFLSYRDVANETAKEKEMIERGKYANTPEIWEEPISCMRNKISIVSPDQQLDVSKEVQDVCALLQIALDLRKKYLFVPSNEFRSHNNPPVGQQPFTPIPIPDENKEYTCNFDGNGVFKLFQNGMPCFECVSFAEYIVDINALGRIAAHGPCKTVCFKRLQLLEQKFNLHVLLNDNLEKKAQKAVPHRDFYNTRKVDVHVHHSSAMNQKHLLKFIKKKLRTEGNDVVIFRDEKYLTLQQVFESLNLTAYDLSVDTLDMHADSVTFHRFDRFNLKYNPCGQSRLREIFLKTDNYIKGRYLAELTKELCKELTESKYQYVEWRISIYGRGKEEWLKLADWLIDNEIFCDNVRWLIQIPRLYSVYKKTGAAGIHSFSDMLHNIFQPLFEVTLNPKSNPKLFNLLRHVVGFDSVDDESKPEGKLYREMEQPNEWTSDKNPPYSYYLYYLYANIYKLNKLREALGMNMFQLRPHSGEAGDADHLCAAFLTSDHINHGINLRKTPAMQYLFYLTQIGLALSPLSNNALFLNYEGLNVTLSTDDPLQFHCSKEALIEEYSVAKSVWKLSSCDLAEISRYSVLQSGFEHWMKCQWLGENYHLSDVHGNDIRKTNIPDMRVAFRDETRADELAFIQMHTGHSTFDLTRSIAM